jgi:hypothetical protein
MQDLDKALKTLGIVRVKAEYSGGNDEGGVDGVTGYAKDGTEVKIEQVYQERRTYDYSLGKWVDNDPVALTDAQNAANEIWSALSRPVYDVYGSFAGEFSTYGTVEYTLGDDQPKMGGMESEEVWHPKEW